MKRIINLFAVITFAAAIFSGAFVSCDKPEEPKEDEKPVVTPGGTPDDTTATPPADTTDTPDVPDVPDTPEPEFSTPSVITFEDGQPDVPHPDVAFSVYDGREPGVIRLSEDAVSVEVTAVETNTIKFVCRPGDNVAAYVLDVYPLSFFYNNIIEGGVNLQDAREVDQLILDVLFTAGSGGYTFTPEIMGEDDYLEYEFDWSNCEYSQQDILPNAQYILAVAACYDESATSSTVTDLSLIYLESDSEELIGNPSLDLNINAGYKTYACQVIPNADCKGWYFLDTNASEVDEYLDIFGTRLLRDFLRHRSVPNDPIGVDNPDDLFVSHTFSNPDPNLDLTFCAVAVDANGTPAKDIVRKDFNLKSVPDSAEPAYCSMAVREDRLGASYFEMTAELDVNCQVMFYVILPASEAETYRNADEATRKALAAEIADGGWGIRNNNFKFDEANGVPTGGKWTANTQEIDMQPNTEYVAVYIGRNFYQELSDLYFSEPFTTKPLVTDRPEDCLADCTLEFTNVGRANATFNFTYDADNCTIYKFACIEYNDPDFTYSYSYETREEWLRHLYDAVDGENKKVIVNTWYTNYKGFDSYTMFDMPVGKKTAYAYVAEDINGVVSEVKFASFTTTAPQPGPNPQMSIQTTYNPDQRNWTVQYVTGDDTAGFNYITFDATSYPEMINDDILAGSSDYRAYLLYNGWLEYVVTYGLQSNFDKVTVTTDPDVLNLVTCVGFGQNEDGTEAISQLYYYILTPDGKKYILSDLYPGYTSDPMIGK